MHVIKKTTIPVAQYADLECFQVPVQVLSLYSASLSQVICEEIPGRRGENKVIALYSDIDAEFEAQGTPGEFVLHVVKEGDVTPVPEGNVPPIVFGRFKDDGRWWMVFCEKVYPETELPRETISPEAPLGLAAPAPREDAGTPVLSAEPPPASAAGTYSTDGGSEQQSRSERTESAQSPDTSTAS